MKNRKYFMYVAVAATAMSAFTACSNEEEVLLGAAPETTVTEPQGHPLTISAGIASTAKRLTGQETDTGLKFSWDVADKLYMLTSSDGQTWDQTIYTFAAKEVDADNAAKATFVCDNFMFTEGTTKVKFVYMPGNVTTAEELEKGAQNLGTQDGTIAGVAGKLRMESPVLDAASEEEVKNLVATLSHSNAIMKVVVTKSDIEWGDNAFAPTEITMMLESSTIVMNGTTDNTVTISNPSAAWDAEGKLTANVVVCMDGTVSENDRWIFTAKDGLGNLLVKATSSAKLLAGGKRYNAPVTFTTEDYFPFIKNYFNPSIWDNGSFDEAQKSFTTAAYGFSGWSSEVGYPSAWNLSKYDYLVIELAEGSVMNASFRMFDEPSYWATQSRLLCDKTQNVIDLTQPVDKWKNDDETEGTLDITKIAIAGFWSFGDGAIIIKKMYLTHTAPDTPTPPTPPVGDGNTEVEVPGIDDSGESAF